MNIIDGEAQVREAQFGNRSTTSAYGFWLAEGEQFNRQIPSPEELARELHLIELHKGGELRADLMTFRQAKAQAIAIKSDGSLQLGDANSDMRKGCRHDDLISEGEACRVRRTRQ